ncbi:MAG TPA: protein kinase, partial [Pirellulales bacterium]|nr:protein kinase [Pirellulales bacterium]
MSIAIDHFVKQLEESGVLSPGKLKEFLPPNASPKDAESLARELIKQGQLTKFQAQQVLGGRAKALFLGNYTILDKLGAGGMGQVFKAQHRRMKRLVAIKMLPPAMTKDAAALARFQREVEAAAKLSHPNIVAAHDADEANGVHFLVMEYVEGRDLSATVKKDGPLSLGKALGYIVQAGRGLEFAHKKGVVHRDIKPANLLLDNEGTVKILDMGLARIDQPGGDAAELTGTGAVMGTVDYMAPEQARNTKHADARADIYSLGCSLYYLLAGKPTFDGDTVVEKILAHRDETIPTLKDVCPGASDRLQGVFEKMVAKRIDDRYQTMTDALAALESCLAESSATGAAATGAWQAPVVGSSELSVMMGNQNLRSIDTPDDFRIETAPSRSAPAPCGSPGAQGRNGPPWTNTKLLIGAGGAAFFALLLGVIVVIRNQQGEVIAKVEAPAGSSVEVKADSEKPKADAAQPPISNLKSPVPNSASVVYLDDLPEKSYVGFNNHLYKPGRNRADATALAEVFLAEPPEHTLMMQSASSITSSDAASRVVYDLAQGFSRFQAKFRVRARKSTTPVFAEVWGDGKRLWESGDLVPRKVGGATADVDVTGVRDLMLVARTGKDTEAAHVLLIEPRLTPDLKPGTPGAAATNIGNAPASPPSSAALTAAAGLWTIADQQPIGPTQLGAPGMNNPQVSQDGLAIVFDVRDKAEPDVWLATRTSVDAPWEKGQRLTNEIDSDKEDGYAALSQDRKTLVFLSKRDNDHLWIATRSTAHGDFDKPTKLGPEINLPKFRSWCPGLSADAGWLTFTRFIDGIGTRQTGFIARRHGADYLDPQPLGPAIDALGLVRDSAVTNDGLTLVVAMGRDTKPGTPAELWTATRSKTTEPFVNPIRLGDDLIGDGRLTGPVLSGDGATLWFVRTGELIRATRTASTPAADYALKFDGNDRVEIPGLKFDVAQPYTMEVFVTSPAKADKGDGMVCGYPDYSFLSYTKGGYWRWVCLLILGTKDTYGISNAAAHPQRTHLACVHDGPTHSLYVDGKLFQSKDFV